jgi:prevent-host-death family protein
MRPSRRPSVSTVAARSNLAEVVNRVAYGKERVVLTRRGRALAAVVPIEDMAALESLEDRDDRRDALAAKAEMKRLRSKGVTLDALLKEFGVKP